MKCQAPPDATWVWGDVFPNSCDHTSFGILRAAWLALRRLATPLRMLLKSIASKTVFTKELFHWRSPAGSARSMQSKHGPHDFELRCVARLLATISQSRRAGTLALAMKSPIIEFEKVADIIRNQDKASDTSTKMLWNMQWGLLAAVSHKLKSYLLSVRGQFPSAMSSAFCFRPPCFGEICVVPSRSCQW